MLITKIYLVSINNQNIFKLYQYFALLILTYNEQYKKKIKKNFPVKSGNTRLKSVTTP